MFATCKITFNVIQGYQKRSYSTDNIALPFLRHSETLVKTVHFTHPLVWGELPSVLWHCWFGGRKGIQTGNGGGHWLVRMEWCPARWSVWLPLLIFPCKISPEVLFLHRVTWMVTEKRAIKRLRVLVWGHPTGISPRRRSEKSKYQGYHVASIAWRLVQSF